MDPIYELSGMLRARLRADTAVAGLVGNRVYERPPDTGQAVSPYISIGSWSSADDSADCIDTQEVSVQIDCWSFGGSDDEGAVKKIAGAVRKSLNDVEFNLTNNALATINHRITRYQRESDAVTARAIVTVTAVVEAAS